MTKFFHGLALASALTLAPLSSALAHKVVASAWADGGDIEGEIGFSNGDYAPAGTRVEVKGPDGETLGEAEVDDEGLFRFTPSRAIEHHFFANLGAGHVASFVLPVDELPEGIASGTGPQVISSAQASTADAPAGTPVAQAKVTPELKALIAEAVQREIKPLRRDIAAYQEKNDLQRIIGGLGYIAGIFGLIFFIYGNRRKSGD